MLAESGGSSKSPASTTWTVRSPTRSSTKRAHATACSSRSYSWPISYVGLWWTNSTGPNGAGAFDLGHDGRTPRQGNPVGDVQVDLADRAQRPPAGQRRPDTVGRPVRVPGD